ncbi:hypothetical protein B0H10DRAFT_2221152 [Mycena sp. CBHHK59/15]|nr:hypothetical protein B0H10DRAFT_2221152 [Mycena sp. CBHHK59/15]
MTAKSPDVPGHHPTRVVRSAAIHLGADRVVALIEAEIEAQTATAQKEIAELRASLADARRREEALENDLTILRSSESAAKVELQQAREKTQRMLGVLSTFGISCRENGEVFEYDAEWCWLFEALKPDGEHSEAGEENEDGEDSSANADPIRDLARARMLLGKRQARAKRWKEKYYALERDRNEGMTREIAELRRQLTLVQKDAHRPSHPSSPPL